MRTGLPEGRLAAGLLALASSLAWASGGSGPSQRIRVAADVASAQYVFNNFNDDHLTISYSLKKSALDSYEARYGYTRAEAAAAKDIRAYMASRGFRLVGPNTVAVDMPKIVRENGPLLRPVAAAFEKVASSQHYDQGDIIGAVASLVQTAMIYKIPPSEVGDRHTGGILPPVSAILRGWGDCDTKSGVVASILSNWPNMRLVGVGPPGHYLVGVLRIPNKGDLFVEYEGLQYVLVEPAGPAWLPPGTVADSTQDLLAGSEGYRIEPFFQ